MADRPPADKDEAQPKRLYDHVRDYFKLPRFRMDFGAKHNFKEFWDKRKEGRQERRQERRP